MTDEATVQSLIAGTERAFPSIRSDSQAADIRKRYEAVGTQIIAQEIEQVGAVHDRSIPEVDGDIPVRVYSPRRTGDAVAPLVLFCHGGGEHLPDPRKGIGP